MSTTAKAKKKEVIQDLMVAFKEAQEQVMASKRDASRIKYVRPSQLPFCPVNFFITHSTLGMVSTMDFMGAFYTTVGTAVHEVMQRYLSPTGKFLADWECKICGKRRKLSTKSECCDFTMEYHELLINYKGVVGHIDAVFKDRKGRYWILDFKTCTLSGAQYKAKSPGAAYAEQVETYALMLYKQYGIKVEGVMLMFLPRDNPKEPTVWVRLMTNTRFKEAQARIKTYKRQHKEVLAIETMKEAIALAQYGRCKSEWCRTCKNPESLKTQIKRAFKIGEQKKHIPLIDL